jgi:hypothetical protein
VKLSFFFFVHVQFLSSFIIKKNKMKNEKISKAIIYIFCLFFWYF